MWERSWFLDFESEVEKTQSADWKIWWTPACTDYHPLTNAGSSELVNNGRSVIFFYQGLEFNRCLVNSQWGVAVGSKFLWKELDQNIFTRRWKHSVGAAKRLIQARIFLKQFKKSEMTFETGTKCVPQLPLMDHFSNILLYYICKDLGGGGWGRDGG